MQSQLDSDRASLRTNLISTDRPDSSQLVDLHVYIIPKHVWKDRQNLAENEAMEQAVSSGFVRVPQNMTIQDLRLQIVNVCGQDEDFPKEFVYLRSVGRCLTKVKLQQENELRVKNYRPPITFAPEIYILEGQHEDEPSTTPNSKRYLYRESPILPNVTSPPHLTNSRPQSLIKPTPHPPPGLQTHPSFVQSGERQHSNSFIGLPNTSLSNLSIASSTLSARELSKLREEQERLRLRQIELARQRREMEQEQQKRDKDLREKQQKQSKEQYQKEEVAAVRIQTAYRDYRTRRKTAEDQQQRQKSNFVENRGLWSPSPDDESSNKSKDAHSIPFDDKSQNWRTEHQWSASSSLKCEDIPVNITENNQSAPFSPFRQAANEIERLQKEAREFTRRKAEEEHAEEAQAHDVAKLSDQLEGLKTKRKELEASRESIVRQMQQFHAQIAVRRKEERDLWKQKYLTEKKKTTTLEEQTQAKPKDEGDVKTQIDQAKLRLNNYIQLREQAENECQYLKHELHRIRSNIKTIEKNSLPKQPPPPPPPSKQQNHHHHHHNHHNHHPQQQQQQPTTIPINLDITLQY